MGELVTFTKSMEGLLRGLLFDFLDPSGLAGELAHIVDASPTDTSMADDFDAGDRWRVNREDPLDADAIGDLADGSRLADPVATTLDDNAFVDLDPLLLVFDDPDVDPNGVAAREVGDVVAELTGSDFFNNLVVHVVSS